MTHKELEKWINDNIQDGLGLGPGDVVMALLLLVPASKLDQAKADIIKRHNN